MRKTLLISAIALNIIPSAMAFEVSSNSFKEGETLPMKQVFNQFGCKGENLSPALAWKDAPEGTKSFAITAYDPDAPTGSGWWHWVAFNIPTSTTSLEEGATLPEGSVQSKTDYGSTEYGGACPPVGHGSHTYHFTVHALDTEKLELDENASGAMVGYYLHNHTIKKASISATYERK